MITLSEMIVFIQSRWENQAIRAMDCSSYNTIKL